MKRQTAQEIDRQAADWAAKVDRGLSADEQADLDRWLGLDARRLGAYGRMRAIALQTERLTALGPIHSPHAFTPVPSLSRRSLLRAGAIAAGLAACGFSGLYWLTRNRHRTSKGEVRQLALQDGSVVTLNTETDLSVALHRDRREVSLATGEALFDVAHDRARPFVVAAGTTRVRVLGTSFVVRAMPGQAVQVLVREGIVEVSREDLTAPPRRITRNMRAVSAAEEKGGASVITVSDVPNAVVERALAWRDGRVDFEGETLEAAAAEFARYSDTRITADPALAREQIAGVYQTNDPVGFARAVAGSLRADISISDGAIHIGKQ
jgi:transmembrane sensor